MATRIRIHLCPPIANARSAIGIVFAIGDWWLYHKYMEVQTLPAEPDHYRVAED